MQFCVGDKQYATQEWHAETQKFGLCKSALRDLLTATRMPPPAITCSDSPDYKFQPA